MQFQKVSKFCIELVFQFSAVLRETAGETKIVRGGEVKESKVYVLGKDMKGSVFLGLPVIFNCSSPLAFMAQ